ncbi:MAG TPA: hypothetical protein VM364_20365 [Vicinamibacterales bacterium]|nr:hypothetical protein [Vicinamibacterales bacterium]
MRRVTHILRADVRRFRWPIAAWILLTAGAFTIEGTSPFVSDWRSVGSMQTGEALLALARAITGVTLIVLIVQAHALVGTTAFWLTRPFPPLALMAAKLLLLAALFLVVPAIAEAVLMSAYRVPPARIAGVTFDATLLRAALVVCLAVGAGLARTLARFAVLAGAVLAAVVLLGFVVMLIDTWRSASVNATATLSVGRPMVFGWMMPPKDATAGIAACVVFLGTALLLLRAQYRRRARARVIALAVTVPVLSAIVWALWPWHVLQADPAPPVWARDGLSIAPDDSPPVVYRTQIGEADARQRVVRLPLIASGVPSGWLASARLVRATYTMDDSEVQSRPGSWPALVAVGETTSSFTSEFLNGLLDVDRTIGGLGFPPDTGVEILSVDDEQLPVEGASGRYRGELEVALLNVAIVARLPLKRGQVFQEGAYRLVIDEVRLDRTPGVRVRVSQALSSVGRTYPPVYAVFLRDSGQRVAIGSDSFAIGQFNPFTPVLASSFVYGWGWHFYTPWTSGFQARAEWVTFRTAHVRTYAPGSGGPVEAPPVEIEWSDAELVVLRLTDAGALHRTLEIDRLVLPKPVEYRLEGGIQQVFPGQ